MSEPGDDRDDRDDDPVLRSMRSVWLSMRDEEPPSSGLAELLAAARDKAEQMHPKPAWWRRAFVAMWRPPVLALATVVVLVGGAVVLRNRNSDVNVADEQRASETTRPASSPELDASLGTAAGSAASIDQPGAGSSDGVVVESPAITQPPPPPVRPANRHKPPVVVTSKPDQTKAESGADHGTEDNDATKDQKKEAEPPKQGEPLSIATDDLTGESVPVTATSPAKSASDTRAPTPRPATIEQLVKQAETAAARGDCAAVRVTLERIKKLSPEIYRDRAKQPAIARCL
ncbi:MAG TPA: hypothetical protein VFQ53_09860 [Kofleriaceae bacterium]|nr:hypothetical protein [Kofleriaceae bacterium]